MSASSCVNQLSLVMNKYSTDKNESCHNYARQYESIVAPFRDKPIKLLEIGVFRGQSLLVWREYFHNAKAIVGIDIDANASKFNDPQRDVFVVIGDATDASTLSEISIKYGPFDIIIDDGSHRNSDVRKSFENLFPLLNDEGVYIVEDTITYKVPCFQDQTEIDQLGYFANLTRFLNQWRRDDSVGNIKDNSVDPFKIEKKTNNPLEYGIDSILFGCSFIAVKKLVRRHWIG